MQRRNLAVYMPVNHLIPESGTGSVIESRTHESYRMRRIRKFHQDDRHIKPGGSGFFVAELARTLSIRRYLKQTIHNSLHSMN